MGSTTKYGALLALLLVAVHPDRAASMSLFGGGEEAVLVFDTADIDIYGPMVFKTGAAVRYLVTASQGQNASATADILVVKYGKQSSLVVHKDGANSVYLAFIDKELTSTDGWENDTARVPWLEKYVYTAEAPTKVLSVFSELVAANGTTGKLPTAVKQLMGNTTLKGVTCTGEGPGGSLAVLCGVSSALLFPTAAVDVITFDAAWVGFNPQTAWAFDRFISLFYFWPFNTTADRPEPDMTGVPPEANQEVHKFARTVRDAILESSLKRAVTLPNPLAALPSDFQDLEKDDLLLPDGWEYGNATQQCSDSFNTTTYGGKSKVCYDNTPLVKDLGPLAPAPTGSLPAPAATPPRSSCPPIVCRATRLLDMSCVGFGDEVPPPVLRGLPYRVLKDKSGADAIVAWDAATKEAIMLWKYTEEERDWLTDANGILTSDFFFNLGATIPAARDVYKLTDEALVHTGFYNQFKSLVLEGEGPNNMTAMIMELSGGEDPLYVSVSGFSLGGGLTELGAVWAAYRFPRARVMAATQGAPKVGNADYSTMYRGTVGIVYRFVYNMDEVSSLPPLSSYVITRNQLWITRDQAGGAFEVLLSNRPNTRQGVTTWYDHWCDVFYVPILTNQTKALSVPQWIYNASAASEAAASGAARSCAAHSVGALLALTMTALLALA